MLGSWAGAVVASIASLGSPHCPRACCAKGSLLSVWHPPVLPDNPLLQLQVFCQGIHLPQCLGPKPWSWPVCSDQLSGPAIYLSNLACGVDPPTLVSQSAPLPAAVGVRTCQRPTRPNVSPSACSSTPGSPSSPLPVSIRASTCWLSKCWPC